MVGYSNNTVGVSLTPIHSSSCAASAIMCAEESPYGGEF